MTMHWKTSVAKINICMPLEQQWTSSTVYGNSHIIDSKNSFTSKYRWDTNIRIAVLMMALN